MAGQPGYSGSLSRPAAPRGATVPPAPMTSTPLPDRPTAAPTPARPAQRLLRATRDRTHWARATADGERLVKCYELGTAEDARAEFEAARLAPVDGVLVYHAHGVDPWLGRPCVVTDLHAGLDLDTWLRERGTLTPRHAARVLLAVVRTLARMHGWRDRRAPAGVAHRDVKPANLLLCGESPDPATADVLLLDLEHAIPIGESDAELRGGFAGGTREWAPPEAFAGAPAAAALDVHGLGVTLHAMLTGMTPGIAGGSRVPTGPVQTCGGRWRRRLRGQPPALVALILRCTAPAAEARPALDEVARELEQYLAEASPDELRLEEARGAIAAAELLRAGELLAEVGDGARAESLRRLRQQASRLLHRLPAVQRALPAEALPRAQALLDQTEAIALLAERLPAAPVTLRLRVTHLQALAELIEGLPARLQTCMAAGSFDVADGLLHASLSALEATERRLGPLPLRIAAEDAAPTLLQRDPRRYVRGALDEVRSRQQLVGRAQARIQDAEAVLDPQAGERAVGELALQLGGSAEVVATLRDRVHRLRFYLDRAARLAPRLPALAAQLEAFEIPLDLTPVRALLVRGARAAAGETDTAARGGGIRPLLRVWNDLAREFPHAAPALDAALMALDRAAAALTDCAWQLLDEATTKLAAVPVPVRPLQGIVNRIDGLRLLEVLVDRPARTRESLLEELERVRLRVDEARALRDRLARGAQEAIERGHLTTAMYEIARAVDRYATDGDEAPATAAQLVEQLEQARRQKRAVQEAAGRNQALAARYAELLDDPASEPKARIELLLQRADVLDYLVRNLQEERAQPYLLDRREVQVALLQERSALAEAELAAASDPIERVRIARGILAALQEPAEEATRSDLSIGRVARLATLWLTRLEQAEAEQRASRALARADRRGRRTRWVALALGILFVVAGTWSVVEATSRPRSLPDRLAESLQRAESVRDRAETERALTRFVALLEADEQPPAITPLAKQVLLAARARSSGSTDPQSAQSAQAAQVRAALETACAQLDAAITADTALSTDLRAALQRFTTLARTH